MAELFADIPEALENTVEIARRCTLELTLGKNYLPDFPMPEGMTMDEFFRRESHAGPGGAPGDAAGSGRPGLCRAPPRPTTSGCDIELDVIISAWAFPATS